MTHEKMKKVLKRIRSFSEMAHATRQEREHLQTLTHTNPQEHEDNLITYLETGTGFVMSPGVVRDILDDKGPIGTGSILTDGEWAWADDLAWYVKTYHIRLPEEFVRHAMQNGWQVPAFSRERLLSLDLPEDD